MEALPSQAPKHEAFETVTVAAVGPSTLFTGTTTFLTQPNWSVIVTEYTPGQSPDTDDVVCPPLHRYAYGGTPPDGATEVEPLH